MRIRDLRTSDVSDVLDQLGTPGVIPGLSPVYEGAVVVGRAMPVMVTRRPDPGRSLREGLIGAIEASDKGDIVVISSESRECATWGGLTSRFAKEWGIGGVVVYGTTRDTDEIAKLRLPVFACGLSPVSGYGRLQVTSVGAPVQCGPRSVERGDLIVGDRDGVAAVSEAIVQDVFERVSRLKAKEKQDTKEILKRLRNELLIRPTR